MRVLGSAVLVLQAVVIGLATLVGLDLADVDTAAVAWTGGLLAALCVVATGLLGSRVGVVLGSLVQVGCLATGFVLPAMFFVGVLFLVLWVAAVHLGRKGDAVRAAHEARVDGS